MKGKKNDFSMTFYNGEERAMFLEFVHDTDKACQWMEKNNKAWTHVMIYHRKTREKLDRISRDKYNS